MRQDLLKRIEPFSKGCFSGNVVDWPQLKPLLKDIHNYLSTAIEYEIENGGEISAGLLPYSETVCVVVESGDPGGDDGEFAVFMQDCLMEWFDGSAVEIITKY
jgi:hypothetical protein